jgi:hypothetical protein
LAEKVILRSLVLFKSAAGEPHRWAAHFFSEGNAARAQMEQIKQEKDTKQIIR